MRNRYFARSAGRSADHSPSNAAARGGDGGVDVGLAGLADLGERLLRRGRERGVGRLGRAPLPAHEEAVGLADGDDPAGLGRGRVVEAARDELAGTSHG